MGMRFLLRPNNPQTLYVFSVIRHVNREILHVAITPSPTAAWVAQQIVECSAWDCSPPRFLIHDRDSRMARLSIAAFGVSALSRCERRSERPLANAISERWVKSVPTECLDHLLVFNESHLRRAIARHVFQLLASAPVTWSTRALRVHCASVSTTSGQLEDHGRARPGWIASHLQACCMMACIFAPFSWRAKNSINWMDEPTTERFPSRRDQEISTSLDT
jgi:hypothetical protein